MSPASAICSLALLAGSLLCARVNAQETEPVAIRFGSVAMDIPAVMYQRLSPLARYLSEELKRPVRLKLSPNMHTAVQDAASGRVDLAYLAPMAYLRAYEAGKVRLIAKTITKGQGTFQLMIVVKNSSPIKTIDDLADKLFAFGDKAAILQRAVVIKAGINLKQLRGYQFLGHFDNIARAVLNGDFDAGILKDTMAYQWQERGLRVLYRSVKLPPYNIVANSDLDPRLYKQIKLALLDLDKTNPRHMQILKALDPDYDGFSTARDSEYNIVRELVNPLSRSDTLLQSN